MKRYGMALAIILLLGASPRALAAGDAGAMPTMADVVQLVDKASGESKSDLAVPIKVAVFFTVLAVLPSLLVMMTSFTRIVIVLGFCRRALTTQNIPPTIAIVGLALFLTFFTMAPTFSEIRRDALDPYLANEIEFTAAIERASLCLREFMVSQMRKADIKLFLDLSGESRPESIEDLSPHVLVPAFIISELRTAFEMGFLIFIPFLVVDLVVASILLSTGMMMLPPVIVSMPFKLLLFILVDGWNLIARSLATSFM